jgi:hypothetical protein
VTARIVHGFTRDPMIGPYVRGKLTLAGLDTRDDAGSYLDATYAIVAEAPTDVLDKMMKEIVKVRARSAPDRATWGLEPEHLRMSAGLQPGPDDGGVAGGPQSRRGRGPRHSGRREAGGAATGVD